MCIPEGFEGFWIGCLFGLAAASVCTTFYYMSRAVHGEVLCRSLLFILNKLVKRGVYFSPYDCAVINVAIDYCNKAR